MTRAKQIPSFRLGKAHTTPKQSAENTISPKSATNFGNYGDYGNSGTAVGLEWGGWPTTAWRYYHSRREYPPSGLKSTNLVARPPNHSRTLDAQKQLLASSEGQAKQILKRPLMRAEAWRYP